MTVSPDDEYLTAFVIRLSKTWCMRAGSNSPWSPVVVASTRETPADSAKGFADSRLERTTSARSAVRRRPGGPAAAARPGEPPRR
ncbi:MAG: hypothetical protein L0K56_11995, partial [Corynebacterium sp.]|nr:hypothetical protein [Corynebacterium sp.]